MSGQPFSGRPGGYGAGAPPGRFDGPVGRYGAPPGGYSGIPPSDGAFAYKNSGNPGYSGGYPAPDLICNNSRVVLDEYNSDIYMIIEPDGLTAENVHRKGFEYLWAGCRATHGVRGRKAFFEVHILENLRVHMPPYEKTPNVLRLGWSLDSGDFELGESQNSYGFGGTGKKSHNNSFGNFGEPFGEGDIMTSYIDLEAERPVILYAKNGKNLGVAFNLPGDCRNQTFYPHIHVKNIKFSVNFGESEPTYAPIAGFTPLASLPVDSLIRCPMSGTNAKEDYEILMMVGLPGAGKTVWSSKWRKDNPEKRYTILGTNTIMDKMKVMGLLRQKNYHGRWDELIKRATDILNEMFKMTPNRARNYILDQTNVYKTARKRKMGNFKGYKRIACVLVNDRDTLMERTEAREKVEGKLVPVHAVKEMMANFSLPDDQIGLVFDEIRYVEADRETARELVREYVNEGEAYKRNESYKPRTDISGVAKRSRVGDDEGGRGAGDGDPKRGRYGGVGQSGGSRRQIEDEDGGNRYERRDSGWDAVRSSEGGRDRCTGRDIKLEEKPRIKEERRSDSRYSGDQRRRDQNVRDRSPRQDKESNEHGRPYRDAGESRYRSRSQAEDRSHESERFRPSEGSHGSRERSVKQEYNSHCQDPPGCYPGNSSSDSYMGPGPSHSYHDAPPVDRFPRGRGGFDLDNQPPEVSKSSYPGPETPRRLQPSDNSNPRQSSVGQFPSSNFEHQGRPPSREFIQGPPHHQSRDFDQGPPHHQSRDFNQGPHSQQGHDFNQGPHSQQEGCDFNQGPPPPQGRDFNHGPPPQQGRDFNQGPPPQQGRDFNHGPPSYQARDFNQGPPHEARDFNQGPPQQARDFNQGPPSHQARDFNQGHPSRQGRDFHQGPPPPQGRDFNQGPPPPQGRDFKQGPPPPQGRDFYQEPPPPQGRDFNQGPPSRQGRDFYQGPPPPQGRGFNLGPPPSADFIQRSSGGPEADQHRPPSSGYNYGPPLFPEGGYSQTHPSMCYDQEIPPEHVMNRGRPASYCDSNNQPEVGQHYQRPPPPSY